MSESIIKVVKEGRHNWFIDGTRRSASKIERQSVEYRLWRESVFKRDGWSCQICGTSGCEVQADHIKPFALYPELRFAIDNGRTLCIPCHKATPTYGFKTNLLMVMQKNT